jgi:hypothetical protein
MDFFDFFALSVMNFKPPQTQGPIWQDVFAAKKTLTPSIW